MRLGEALPEWIAEWRWPLPADGVIRHGATGRGAARLASSLTRPWFDLDLATMSSLRARPELLRSEAWLHFVPAYLAAALTPGCPGREDLFGQLLSSAVPPSYCPATATYLDARVGQLDDRERALLSGAFASIAELIEYPLGIDDARLVRTLSSAPLHQARSVTVDEIEQLRDRLDDVFPAAVPRADEVFENLDELRQLKRVGAALASRAWNGVPSSVFVRDPESIFWLTPAGFAAYLPGYLWAATEARALDLRQTLAFKLGKIVDNSEEPRSRALLSALDTSQRSIVADMLHAYAGTQSAEPALFRIAALLRREL